MASTFGRAIRKKEGKGKWGRGREEERSQASNISIHRRMGNDSMVYGIFRSKFKLYKDNRFLTKI